MAEGISCGVPELADMDGDGELLVGEFSSNTPLHFFENTGTSSEMKFEERTGDANPFAAVPIHRYCFPTLADMDGDRAPDLFMGFMNGTIFYYHNGERDTPTPAPHPSDSYGPCFIGTASGAAPAFGLPGLLAALVGGLSFVGTAPFGHPKG